MDSYHCNADSTHLFLFFPPILLQHPCCSAHLEMSGRHLLLDNCASPQFLFIPGKDCPCTDLSVTVEDVTVWPLSAVRNLAIISDDGLSCSPNITAMDWSCTFALYNIHSIQPFLTKDTTPGPSTGHLPPGPLQLTLNWAPSLCD